MSMDVDGFTSTSTLLFLGTLAYLHKVVITLGNGREVCFYFALVRISGVMIDPRFNFFWSIMQPTNVDLAWRSINSLWEGIKLLLLNPHLSCSDTFKSFFSIITPSFNYEGVEILINRGHPCFDDFKSLELY